METFAVALVLALTATGLCGFAGAVEEPAAAADKTYVTDPTTGNVVVAPQYGGTITFGENGSGSVYEAQQLSGTVNARMPNSGGTVPCGARALAYLTGAEFVLQPTVDALDFDRSR